MNNTKPTGFIQVKVSSAEGAFPVEGAVVLISPNNEEENGVIRSLRTDESGLTDTVALETKSRSLSESPGNPRPFLTYNIEIKKDGYFPVNNMNIPVFEGVKAVLPVNLVPLSRGLSNFDAGANENRVYNYVTDENRLNGDQNEQ